VELQAGEKLKAIRIDNAPELIKQISSWKSVELQTTVPYTSHQNSGAKCSIGITQEGMRALLKDAELPMEFWEDAVVAHNYIRNRVEAPRSTLVPGEAAKTPEEIWTGKPPTVSHMKVWGCKTISYVDPKSVPHSNKQLVDRGRVGVFVGYVEATTKQYRLYAPDMNTVITASTVNFYEDVPGGTIDLKLKKATLGGLPQRQPRGRPRMQPKELGDVAIPKRPVGRPKKIPENIKSDSTAPTVILYHRYRMNSDTQEGIQPTTGNSSLHDPIAEDSVAKGPPGEDLTRPAIQTQKQMQTRSQTRMQMQTKTPTCVERTVNPTVIIPSVSRKRTRFADLQNNNRESKRMRDQDVVEEAMETAMNAAAMSTPHTVEHPIRIPRTYDDAINDPIYGSKWHEAIRTELRQLIMNGTFHEVQKPPNANVVTAKWVFAVKYALNGGVERFKARLVARGFT
jgi:hypothetical protein